MGDFNEVRSRDERQGLCFNPYSARVFDNFISSSGLVDIKMEGYAFTWSHPSASKMSKLDRFLVTDGLLVLFPSITAVCLDRHLSDHHPILLHEVHVDFGSNPFRAVWSCGENKSPGPDGFTFEFFRRYWNTELKNVIRSWIRVKMDQMDGSKRDLIKELRLAQDQAEDLERLVTRDEIRRAVWSCEENKSPGPDGFTFEFFRRYWDPVGIDFCEAVEYFLFMDHLQRGTIHLSLL
nr:RNA-directed DNA polymerase, eukaryota [Tanacetum cinerariifolium]